MKSTLFLHRHLWYNFKISRVYALSEQNKTLFLFNNIDLLI